MADYKEMAIYLVIAIVVILGVVLLGKGIFATGYNVVVKLSSTGQNASYPYQTSYYTINITNNGSSQINNLLVGFYLNGEELSTNTVSIPPRQSILFTRNYTYPQPGTYGFEAVADPGHIDQISDRQLSQSSITERILQPIPANPYSSIPNANIVSTESFTLSGTGAISAVAVAGRYNVSIFRQLFGPGGGVPLKVIENLYGYIAYSNGAYATYANNTIAYTNWLQGTIDPQLVNLIVSSFGSRVQSMPGNVSYAVLNGTTSMCTFYNEGWTKIISLYNASKPETCLNLSGNVYQSNLSDLFVSELKNNTNLTKYQSHFTYTNTTGLGTILQYSKGNLTVTNLFQNDYGLFSSSIKRLGRPINISAYNYTCNGLIYNDNSTSLHVCSYLLPTANGSVALPYGLINSSYLSGNYIINMYSLVNTSQLVSAHFNAGKLIDSLMLNQSSALWSPRFTNSCSFANQSLGCKIVYYNATVNNVTINITNGFSSQIKANSINCEESAGFPNTTIGMTIMPNKTIEVNAHCSILPIPAIAAQSRYVLMLNYTLKNTSRIAIGSLNLTSQGFG